MNVSSSPSLPLFLKCVKETLGFLLWRAGLSSSPCPSVPLELSLVSVDLEDKSFSRASVSAVNLTFLLSLLEIPRSLMLLPLKLPFCSRLNWKCDSHYYLQDSLPLDFARSFPPENLTQEWLVFHFYRPLYSLSVIRSFSFVILYLKDKSRTPLSK